MRLNHNDETIQNLQYKNYFGQQSYQQNQFEEDMTMIQKATLIVNDVTDLLCSEISHGIIEIQDEQKQLPVQKKPLKKSQYLKFQLQQVDVEEHRRKVKTLMQANKRFRQKLNNQTLQFENSLKRSQQGERKTKQSQKLNQIEKRRSQIERRMASKSQLMAKIRQMSIQSEQRFKGIRKQKFLYEEKQKQFKSKVLLPKLQEQKKILEIRKEKMKIMDINGLIEHEKNYYEKKRTHSINRSMTSRIMKSETLYQPPEFVPKSYQIYENEQRIKKQEQMMRIKEAEINKQRVKQYIKNVSEIHKLQKQVSRSRSISPQQIDNSQTDVKKVKNKKVKAKVKELSKKELTEMGNSYFKALKDELKIVKQKRDKRTKQRQEELNRIKQEQEKDRSFQDELQIQIRSESIRTVQKIQKIQRSYKIRSKKIQNIFNDTTIDPLLKYQKLKHQMDNFDMVLKTKNHQSEDIKERTEAAGCYMNAIRAKLKLLEVSASK